MIYSGKVVAALEQKRNHFHRAQRNLAASLRLLDDALAAFEHLSLAEIEEALVEESAPGARPTIEQERDTFIIPFNQQWQCHREAREWAMEVLPGVTTFAADGSQISRTTDISIPVGVVQVGWFENRHLPGESGSYEKGVDVEVLPPDELSGEESGHADQEVEWRRFKAESGQVERFMLARAGDTRALAFFDGSLILSFVQHLTPPRQEAYVRTVMRLLDVSAQTGVPLIGYVDTSYSNDLCRLIARLGGLDRSAILSDGDLLRLRGLGWGDRCRLYHCARQDMVLPMDGRKYYGDVLFTYLQTSTSQRPARIEFPHWVLEEGRHKWVLDVIRAECVIGMGYPYTLESADAVAVLTMPDREHFFALFQAFAEQEGLPLHFSNKMMSKRRRRV